MNLGKFALITLIFTVACFGISYATVPKGEHKHFYPLSLLDSWKNFHIVKNLSGSKDVNISENIPATGIGKLQIHVEAGDIVLRSSETTEVTVNLNGQFSKENPLEIDQRENEIVVRVHEGSLFDGGEGVLEVGIPASIRELMIATVSGQVGGDIPALQSFNLASVSGDLKFSNLDIPSLKIASVSGDIELNGKMSEVNLVSVSGDILVQSENPSASIKVNSTSGDVALSFSSQADARVKFKSVSGEAKIQSGTTSRDFSNDLVLGKGNGAVSIETISGNLLIDGAGQNF